MANATLKARYRIESSLGRGTFGDVYHATNTKTGDPVAVKTIPAALTNDPDFQKTLRRTRALLARAEHPNILVYKDIFPAGSRLCLVTEYVGGGSLAGQGTLPLGRFKYIVTQVAEALARAHALGVVHRALKPSNILLTAGGEPMVADFGLWPLYDLAAEDDPEATLGLLPYRPPEALRGEQPDHRGDLWMLGVLMFEHLAGALPFSGDTVGEMTHAILHDPPLDSYALSYDLSPGWLAILKHCLEKSPLRRYQSAQQLAGDLQAEKRRTGQSFESKYQVEQKQVTWQTEDEEDDWLNAPIEPTQLKPKSRMDAYAPQFVPDDEEAPQAQTRKKKQAEDDAWEQRKKELRARHGTFPAWAVVIGQLLALAGAAVAVIATIPLLLNELALFTVKLPIPSRIAEAGIALGTLAFAVGFIVKVLEIRKDRKLENMEIAGLAFTIGAIWFASFTGVVFDTLLARMVGLLIYIMLISLYFRIA